MCSANHLVSSQLVLSNQFIISSMQMTSETVHDIMKAGACSSLPLSAPNRRRPNKRQLKLMKKFHISCIYCQWPNCKQPHFTSRSLATQAQGQWTLWLWVKMNKWVPPCEKWRLGTWDYACLWPCNSLILPWHLSYHNSFTWWLPAYDCPWDPGLGPSPAQLVGAQLSLGWVGLHSAWEGRERTLAVSRHSHWPWANIQMYNTQLLTHCSPEHLSSCPLASISVQFSWEYSIGGLGTRLRVLPKLFNKY